MNLPLEIFDELALGKSVLPMQKSEVWPQQIFVEYSFSRRSIWVFARARGQMNKTLYQNRPEYTQNWENLYLEPHDCRIYYVNINLRHQYGISAAESQTFCGSNVDL